MDPRVSVIIPSYNKSNFIAETLESLILQSYDRWEAIIVDDGSTDNSTEIIHEYIKKDSRIHLYSRDREPKGGSVCRNIGIEKSKGDYIVFLDADDLLTAKALGQRIKLVEDNPEMDFLVFPTGHFYNKIGDCIKIQTIKEKDNHLLKFLAYEYQWSISSPIWKKSFLNHLGLFDEEYLRLQDIELHTRALMSNHVYYKIISNIEPDCYYRIDPSRRVYDGFIRAKIAMNGFDLFLNKMNKLIKNKYDSRYRNALKNVTFKASRYIINQDLTINDKYVLISQLTLNKTYNDIMTDRDKVVFYFICLKNIVRKSLSVIKKRLTKK